MNAEQIHPKGLRSGDEPFTNGQNPLPSKVTVLDFWKWSASDLLSNIQRGVVAEFLVGHALGVVQDSIRTEWDTYDLRTKAGDKIEVKSAAYVQSWYQKKPSRISWRVKPTRAWDKETNTYEEQSRFQADVYVFCLLGKENMQSVDPLDVSQWRFFVMSRSQLGNTRQIGLSKLKSLHPVEASYGGIEEAIEKSLALRG